MQILMSHLRRLFQYYHCGLCGLCLRRILFQRSCSLHQFCDATTKRFANNNILQQQQQQQNHIVCAQTASTDRDTQGIENESIMRSTRL